MKIPNATLLLALAAVASSAASPPAGLPAASLAAGGNDQRKQGAHENDFLMFGTVFTEKSFALPEAEIRLRRTDERKARWEARSDRRGEFALRVPRGAEYEMIVRAAGYQEQTRKIDARAWNREDLVFRLAPASGGKPK